MSRPLLAVTVAALLVLAGCAAPAADSAQGPEAESPSGEAAGDGAAAPEDGVEVRGGPLPVDANRTLDRVEALLGVDVRPPVVWVEDPAAGPRTTARDPASFHAVLGVPLPEPTDADAEFEVGGVASPMDAVYVSPTDEATAAEIEQVLAHELVHVAQFQADAPARVRDGIPREHRETTDAEFVVLSLLEGSAVYGSSAYTERYDVPVESELALLDRLYPDATPGTKLAWGPYYHGGRYVDARADSPADHWAIYDDPPATMQEVLHGPGAAGSMEPFAVRPAANASAGGDRWERTDADVQGEFVLRTVLETELDRERGAEAARGWEYDRVVRFERPDERVDGYAWTIRTTDAANASALEAALGDYLADRADVVAVNGSRRAPGTIAAAARTRAVWTADAGTGDATYAYSLVSVDDRTVALVAGAPSFVDEASVVPAAGDDVRVVLGDGTNASGTIAAPPAPTAVAHGLDSAVERVPGDGRDPALDRGESVAPARG